MRGLQGKVAAVGPARNILSRFDLLPEDKRDEGGSVLDLTVSGHDEAFGLTVLRSPAGEWRLPLTQAEIGSVVRVQVRARDVMIATTRPEGISALNVLEGRIAGIAPGGGAEALVSVDCCGDRIVARITRRSADLLGLTPGMAVFAIVKTVTFDRSGGTMQIDGA